MKIVKRNHNSLEGARHDYHRTTEEGISFFQRGKIMLSVTSPKRIASAIFIHLWKSVLFRRFMRQKAFRKVPERMLCLLMFSDIRS